jgi:hypothetical protein
MVILALTVSHVSLSRQIKSDKVTVVCLPSGEKKNTWTVVAGFGRSAKERFTESDNRLRQV